MSYDEIRRKLKLYRLQVICDATGLSYPTLLDIRDNKNANPTIKTVEKLREFFKNHG